ncbi:unnamed protein product, partial [Musa acuminata subsp. burmannicoides]
ACLCPEQVHLSFEDLSVTEKLCVISSFTKLTDDRSIKVGSSFSLQHYTMDKELSSYSDLH